MSVLRAAKPENPGIEELHQILRASFAMARCWQNEKRMEHKFHQAFLDKTRTTDYFNDATCIQGAPDKKIVNSSLVRVLHHPTPLDVQTFF